MEGTCPYCATTVRAGSLRCRSCREWFERRCEVCGLVVRGEEARVGRCADHETPLDADEAPAPWHVHYQVGGQGAGTILVYAPLYQSDARGLTRGRAFESLSDLPPWLERAIREDMERTGGRSGVLEVDANVDWWGRDPLERREDGEAGSGVG